MLAHWPSGAKAFVVTGAGLHFNPQQPSPPTGPAQAWGQVKGQESETGCKEREGKGERVCPSLRPFDEIQTCALSSAQRLSPLLGFGPGPADGLEPEPVGFQAAERWSVFLLVSLLLSLRRETGLKTGNKTSSGFRQTAVALSQVGRR